MVKIFKNHVCSMEEVVRISFDNPQGSQYN